jgi:hypothetical protein
VAIADVEVGRTAPLDDVPDRFWLHKRGILPALAWEYQRAHGRWWYRRNALGRPTARVPGPPQPSSVRASSTGR